MKKYFALAAFGLLASASVATATEVLEVNPNNTLATAQNLDSSFSTEANANITNSTTSPHATAIGGNNYEDEFDYYSFTVGTAGSVGIFDIDFASIGVTNSFDAFLRVLDGNGNSLAQNDDAVDPSEGSGAAGQFTLDSYISYAFATPGTYYARVGNCCEGARNGNYQLNVSLDNAVTSAVPEPATWAMMIGGFGMVGGAMRRRKGKVTTRVAFG